MSVDRAIREFLHAGVAAGTFPGAVWWVGAPGGTTTSRGAAGKAALEPEFEVAEEDTLYDLASLTKPLCTALLAARLVDAGDLDPDVPCGEVVEELAGSVWGAVSVIRLATHRSGLPAWDPLYLAGTGMPSYLARIRELEPDGSNGQENYSDLGYIVLGAVLERVAGEPLDRLFDTRIAAPLGLHDIGFAGTAPARFAGAAPTERGNERERAMAGEAGANHAWRSGVLRGEVHDANAHGLGGVAGHAGLFGTARDVAAIGGAILDAPETVRGLMLRPVPAARDRTVGLVLARGSEAARDVLPDDAPGHVGFTGTSLWLLPETAEVAVLLTNRVHPVVAPESFQPVRAGFHRRAIPGAGS